MSDYLNKMDTGEPTAVKFKYGDQIPSINQVENATPLFSYDYLNIDDEFCFTHNAFTKEQYHQYFKKVREYSKIKIQDLINDETREDNFTINNYPSKTMKKQLRKAFKNPKCDDFPLVGHFHLFDKKDRPEDRCPVVHFFVGPLGAFYILCYDPYHEVHCNNKQ